MSWYFKKMQRELKGRLHSAPLLEEVPLDTKEDLDSLEDSLAITWDSRARFHKRSGLRGGGEEVWTFRGTGPDREDIKYTVRYSISSIGNPTFRYPGILYINDREVKVDLDWIEGQDRLDKARLVDYSPREDIDWS